MAGSVTAIGLARHARTPSATDAASHRRRDASPTPGCAPWARRYAATDPAKNAPASGYPCAEAHATASTRRGWTAKTSAVAAAQTRTRLRDDDNGVNSMTAIP